MLIILLTVYDRGNPSQVVSPHQPVDVKTYTGAKVKLPAPDEIPGVDLEVQNYHVPPVGTFHAKYMVVDRKVALLSSNNIQDRVRPTGCTLVPQCSRVMQVNVEMMTHIGEGVVSLFVLS